MNRYVLVPLILCLSAATALAVCPTAHRPVVVGKPFVHAPVVKAVTAPVVVKKVIATDLVTPVVAVEKVVLTPVAVYAPIALAVPAYSAAYVPGAAAPVAPAPAATPVAPAGLDAIMAELRKINGRLDALEKKPTKPADPFNPGTGTGPGVTAPGTAPVKAADVLSILTAKCAACHESKVAATKGGGLTLLEGAVLSKLSDRQARKVLTTVYNGRMPPRSSGLAALTDEEVSTIVAHLDK